MKMFVQGTRPEKLPVKKKEKKHWKDVGNDREKENKLQKRKTEVETDQGKTGRKIL